MRRIFRNIFEDKDNNRKGYILRIIAAIVLALFVACGVELVKNSRILALPEKQRGVHEVPFTVDGDMLRADFPRQYVAAIDYTYEAEGSLCVDVRVRTSEPGEPESFVEIRDNTHRFIRESVERVDCYTDHIELKLVYGENCTITGLFLYNVPAVNGRRMVSVFFVTLAVLLLLLCSNFLSSHLEISFVLIAACLGGIILAITPITKSVWDEGFHFKTAYTMTPGKEVGAGKLICMMMDDNAMSRLNPPKSAEEYRIMKRVINEQASYRLGEEGVVALPRGSFGYADIGYVPAAAALSLGRWMHLPFATIHMMGKMANLLVYILIVYAAIKRCTMGKRLLLVVSLMPTTLYMAASYNRDGILYALGFLGLAYLLSMMAERDSIKTRDFVVATVAFALMSAIKAVYAPLLLLMLVLPKKRFENEKVIWVMRGVVIAGGCLFLLSFMIPALFTNIPGDSRRENTDGAEQMRLILAAPLAYGKTLWNGIKESQLEYLVGRSTYGNLGAYGVIKDNLIIPLFLFGVALTDSGEFYLKWRDKLAISIAGTAVICFVWTAMYISYTAVGASSIDGVQGRYFTLLTMPFLLLFNTDKIRNNLSPRLYNTAISLFLTGFVFWQLYDSIISCYVVS